MPRNGRESLNLWVAGVAGAVLALAATPLSAGPVPSALLVEDQPLPDMPTELVNSINNTAVNHVGGYAVTVNTTGSGTTLSHVWGSADGGPGATLRTEGTIGDLQQNSFESFFGLSNSGSVAYSPSSTDLVAGGTGLDGVWLDDQVVAIEEQPVPGVPGMYWSFGSRPGVTAGDNIYWVGGVTDTPGGSTQGRYLLLGSGATPLLFDGQLIPGLADPLDDLSFDFRLSSLGTHFIAEIGTDTGSSTNDNSMVVDGQVAMSNGAPLTEGSPIPAASGGLPGENWDNFDYAGITQAGIWLITGDTDGDTTTDEIVVLDGQIVYREGDTLGGEVLSGSIEGAYLNEDGDVAFIWDIQDNSLEALFFNDELLVREGDAVDLDGDGEVELDSILTNFTGISSMTMSDRYGADLVDIYFTADVDTPAGTVEGYFRLVVPEPGTLGLLVASILAGLSTRRRR